MSSYKDTLNLPKTGFAMEAKLTANEPLRLKQWQEMRLYEKIQTARSPGKKWVLHDGPPFANGDIHIGHLINKTLKDVFIRFKTMQGFRTPYVPGWDCHGLPIEHKIQEKYKGKLREMGTLAIRQECHAYAANYAKVQSEQFQRLGILGEWANPYLTMNEEYEARTLEVFAKFVDAGLVYKQLKPVPWSVANQTALADAELEYQDVDDLSVYVEFAVEPGSELAKRFDVPAYLLVWTTTPWTLPANLAIAVGPEVEYVAMKYTRAGEARVGLIARELQERVFGLSSELENVSLLSGTFKGSELVGSRYIHPFIDYAGPILTADYVTTTDGTGLVHTAPGHGEDDYDTGIRAGLKVYSPVLANGRFDETVPEFLRGKTTKESNALILEELKMRTRLLATQTIRHSYPHDWRSKTPIIFRATEQWFVSMEKPFASAEGEAASLRARASRACKEQIKFVPEWGMHRIGGMVTNRPDWCISRQRAWGLPIPVFYNEAGQSLLSGNSVRAVARVVREKGADAWFTMEPAELLGTEFKYPAGFSPTNLRKEKDIFDVWFESGSSWHAVLQERTYLSYPADLYLEGSDQHRGWFQLSLLLALGVTGEPPFKQVLTHGFVVKPDGTKVSKSDKEYVKAVDEINRHGADVLRLWCSSVDYQGDIPASPQALKEFGDKYRKIRNTLRFLLSNLYDFDPHAAPAIPEASLDAWALAQLSELTSEVTAAYEAYQLHRVFRLLHDFCSVQLSAIYGNAMKDRLYCESPGSPLRRRCQAVMHQLVVGLTKLLAPILVFTADEAWEQIPHKPGDEADMQSVHLALLLTAPASAVAEDCKVLMELRESALSQLDELKKKAGMNKALDAELMYHIGDSELQRRLEAFGADLEDIVGAGSHSFASAASGTPRVEVIDRRNDYQACARSWKRRADVGTDARFPELSQRDAQVMASRPATA